jgi:hypothetical protein
LANAARHYFEFDPSRSFAEVSPSEARVAQRLPCFLPAN